MTRKDYLAIANAIANTGDEYGNYAPLSAVVEELIPYLQKDNPNFDADRFRKAANREQ